MVYKISFFKELILFVLLALTINISSFAQQDPQYTQYMYNTMSVNPAYAGQRDVLSVTGLHRTQWVGIEGAPQTQTFAFHTPLRNDRLGLGLSVVNDAIGPVNEYYVDANFSYTILVSDDNTKLSFGVKGGVHGLTSDWSQGVIQQIGDPTFADNLSVFSPTIGAGIYLHKRKWYIGLSVPNFLSTEHFDDNQISVAKERMSYYLIGGYVFDLSANTKFKPAGLIKAVSGAPIIADLSANFLFNKKLTLGVAWRWDDSVSGLAGFQVTDGLYIGYSYDATTTNLSSYNNGSHEIMLRFELQKVGKILSPRFF